MLGTKVWQEQRLARDDGQVIFSSFFFLSCHFLFFFLNVFLNADGLVTECVFGIFHIDDDDVSAFYAFQELLKKMSHGRTQANSSVPRNPNYINLLILNPYLLLSGNDNNRENLKTTIFLSKKHVGMRDCRIMLKRSIRSNNFCSTSCRKPCWECLKSAIREIMQAL